jgi:hypothetical protein
MLKRFDFYFLWYMVWFQQFIIKLRFSVFYDDFITLCGFLIQFIERRLIWLTFFFEFLGLREYVWIMRHFNFYKFSNLHKSVASFLISYLTILESPPYCDSFYKTLTHKVFRLVYSIIAKYIQLFQLYTYHN